MRFAILQLLLASGVMAEPLSQLERIELGERLDDLRAEARKRAAEHLAVASSAFSRAAASDEAAIELYEKCVEKSAYANRKASDFRDWRSRNKAMLDDPGFALALRHQLRWSVLTIRAAVNPEDHLALADDALAALDAIFATPLDLRRHIAVLGQPVLGTHFARAYGLAGYEVRGWPMSPVEGKGRAGARVAAPFEQLILPSLRAKGDASRLRAAWERRIRFEEIACGFWSNEEPDEKSPGNSEEREKFLLEDEPELRWRMEVDLFRSGDEKTAAVALLELLKANIGHSQARQWETEFRELVKVPPP